jgi:hypothetical protein
MTRAIVRRVFSFVALLALFPGFQLVSAQGTDRAPAAGATLLSQQQRTVNVELILDSSGSMAETIDGGQTRIDAAKQVLNEVIDALPERDGINVGFRVYGHKGTNTEAGRSESCRSSELKVPISGVDKAALLAQVQTYTPVGWTPISRSLRESLNDFGAASANDLNAVVLVTDGLETCGGDPCAASRSLKQSPKAITTHVIGFALSDDERANLQCIVDESGGLLLGAQNASELSEALFKVLEEIEVVAQTGTLEIEEIGGFFPAASVAPAPAADAATPVAAAPIAMDANSIELDAGNYLVSWTNPSGTQTTLPVQIEANQVTRVRGSVLKFPHGAGEIYTLKAQDGTVIWQDQIESGDQVWLLPGIYRLSLVELTGDAVLLSMDVQTLPGSITEIDVTTAP